MNATEFRGSRSVPSGRVALALCLCLSLVSACGDDAGGDADAADTTSDATPDAGDTSPDVSSDAASDADATEDAVVPDSEGDLTADAEPDVGPDAGPPPIDAPGPWRVAYRSVDASYDRPDGGGARTSRLAIWYPTTDEPGPPPFYFGLFPRPGVVENGAPAIASPAPVLVYSHGHGGYPEASADLVERFASHGWIVVAPEHTGNTTADLGTPRDTDIYHLRAADVSAALDWLEALEAPDPLAGLASDRVIVAGHSFGGYTAATLLGAGFSQARLDGCEEPDASGEFCSSFDADDRARFEAGLSDDRILAAIFMAAGNFGEFGEDGVAQIDRPVLLMTGGHDTDVSNASNGDPYWAILQRDSRSVRVNFPRGCHQTFAVGCGLPADLPAAEGFALVDEYALAFARRWALDDRTHDELLSGADPRSVEAEVTAGGMER
ncbi:MAG: alpha/beta hydrolase [Myxococcales bacterium]|nr:alpha/beta hydrolase [Myxococcales bacterium]MCB9530211.1 alpha/beta hydrolase [Myxococcales bacterium]MCB9533724.1 alpha/beta hydrolase [Myxococcales bacterium]